MNAIIPSTLLRLALKLDAVAAGLTQPDAYFRDLTQTLQAKRDRLSAGLAQLGYEVLPAAGTYFVVAGFSGLSTESDVEFARRMTIEARVATIPLSAFYETGGDTAFIRFCFSKRDEVLDAALERFSDWHR